MPRMVSRARSAQWSCFVAVLVSSALISSAARGQGIYISASGAVNRGMGGASTAAPIDAIGAMYWNPATINGLEHSELEFGMDMIYSNHDISSTFGPFSGTTESDNGIFPVPAVSWVHHTSNPAVTFGLSVGGVAGFKTNIISDASNPVLM